MENNQNSTPPQGPQYQAPQQPYNASRPQGGGNVYFGNGPGGTARPMPSRRRLYAIAGAATVLVLATGGYVLGFYLPNRPANIYKSALSNTADGYDQLIDYAGNKDVAKKFDNNETNGTYKLSADGFATDGTFKAHSDSKNATFSGDLGLGTTRLKVDGVVKDVASSESPDVYLKVGGIKGLGANFGMPGLDNIDSQWVTIDHSMIDTLTQQAQASQGLDASKTTAPSEDQVMDAAKVIGEQSRKYVFTANKTDAVFTMDKFVGKETVDGKPTNHYKVHANKAHLKTYVEELGKALDKSKLNDWSKATYKKNLSEAMNLEQMAKDTDNIKSGEDSFDLWVNTKTKTIHKIRIADTKDSKDNYMEFGMNYDGGAEKPLFLNVHTKQNGQTTMGMLNITLNTQTNKVKVGAELDSDQDGSNAVKFKLDMTVQPASGKVDASAPDGAISLSEAMQRVGLGAYAQLLGGGLGQEMPGISDSSSDPFTLSL